MVNCSCPPDKKKAIFKTNYTMTAFKTLIALLFIFTLFAQSVTALVMRIPTVTVADAVNVIRSKNGLKPVNDNP